VVIRVVRPCRARTHSTIAAISSAVPTLSLAYAQARGLNQDIFGSQEFCLQPTETTPTTVAERVSHLLERSDALSSASQVSYQEQKRALQGGAILRRWLKADDHLSNHSCLQ